MTQRFFWLRIVLSMLLGMGLCAFLVFHLNVHTEDWQRLLRGVSFPWCVVVVALTALLWWSGARKWALWSKALHGDAGREPEVGFFLRHVAWQNWIGQFVPPTLAIIVGRSWAARQAQGLKWGEGAANGAFDQLMEFALLAGLLPAAWLVLQDHSGVAVLLPMAAIGFLGVGGMFWLLRRFLPAGVAAFLPSLMAWSLLRVLLTLVRLVVGASALGLAVNPVAIVAAAPVVALLVLVPLTPGNLGLAEWGWVGVLAYGGADSVEAGLFALGIRLLMFAVQTALIGAFYIAGRFGVVRSAAFVIRDKAMRETNPLLSLFAAILREAPFQPATDLWRAYELLTLKAEAFPLLREGRSFLDLGCGDGGIMEALRPHLPESATIVGVDVDPAETERAATRGVYAKVFCASAESLPIKDSSLDAIISNSVLEHIAPIDAVLRESARVLHSGGWFVATVPCVSFYRCLSGPWLPWISRDSYERSLDQRLAHRHVWSAETWRQRMAAAGINLVDARPYLTDSAVRRWELLSRLTGGLLYHVSGQKTPPIILQRRLGLRDGMKLPRPVANILARFLMGGVRHEESSLFGCLLLIGRKM